MINLTSEFPYDVATRLGQYEAQQLHLERLLAKDDALLPDIEQPTPRPFIPQKWTLEQTLRVIGGAINRELKSFVNI